MREILEFYKWGVSYKQESDIISMAFMAATLLLFAAYAFTGIAILMAGYPLITGLMVLVPLAFVVRVAARKYKDQQRDARGQEEGGGR